MDLALDDFRQDRRRITLGFADQQPSERFRIQGVRRIQTSGRQVTQLLCARTSRRYRLCPVTSQEAVRVPPRRHR